MTTKNIFAKSGSVLLLCSILLVAGCQSDKKEGDSEAKEKEKKEALNKESKEEIDQLSESQKNILYAMPSPFEITSLLQTAGVKFDMGVLNSPENVSNYSTSNKKALNIGVYGADLSFTSMFDHPQESMQFFASVKKLSSDLGISSAFSPEIMSRLEANKANKDSVQTIVSQSLMEANAFLKENERTSLSSLILTGGWIEGLYIATQLTSVDDPSEDMLMLIADQKFALENMIDLLSMQKDNADIKPVLAQMKELHKIYEGLGKKETEKVKQETDTDKKMTVIGGGPSIEMTPAQLKEVKGKVAEIRNSFVK